MNSYQEMYINVNKEFGKVIKQSLENSNGKQHAKVANFFEDYSKWMDFIYDNNEVAIYMEAKSEYKTMLLFLCMGLYKNAYMSLRGYFELTMFGVMVSTCDMDFRLWKNGEKDVHWSEIIDKDNGIFGEKYIKVYNNTLIQQKNPMREEAKELYRVCSEYIHSGYKVTSKDIEVNFDQDVFLKICKDVSRINRIITYSFCVRYGEQLKKSEQKSEIEVSILEQLSDIRAVHKYLQ